MVHGYNYSSWGLVETARGVFAQHQNDPCSASFANRTAVQTAYET
jgi:hypothetical protein